MSHASKPDSSTDFQRRRLLQLIGAGGVVLAAGASGIRRLNAAEVAPLAAADGWSPLAYVVLHDDGIVTLICHRSEMGQGIRTTMPMVIADEMEADWSKCRVQQADGDAKKYGSQNTDGSTSIRPFLDKYRETGATMRALLEDAAASQWQVPHSEVHAEQHWIVHASTGRRLPFAALVASARKLPMPPPERVRIKSPAERRWQGKKMPSIDLVPMTSGGATYGADVVLPGMHTAVIARPAVWGARLVSMDDSAARQIPGVKRIIKLPETPVSSGFLPLGGVAVVATSTWAAIKGRDALKLSWDNGANGAYDSKSYKQALLTAVRADGAPGRSLGNAVKAIAEAPRKFSAEYYMPHLSHAQLEPMTAVARFSNGAVEAWAPTQSPQDARDTLAKYLGIDAAQVTVHVTLLGGGFGRKSKPDYICEAAWLAREVGAPVRVQWTRTDDLQHSYYHSVAAHRFDAGLDAAGRVVAWRHRSAYPPIAATFAPNVPGPEPDDLTNGASDLPFAIPNLSVEVCPAVAHARIGWFRSVNAIHHGFAIGSFVDELAHLAGRDTASFLLELLGPDRQVDLSKDGLVAPASNYDGSWSDYPLDSARAKAVVRLAAEKSGFATPLPRGRGRGIAVMRSFLTYVAMVIEVEVKDDGTVLVPRATAVVDAGYVVNPDRARAQMEGAVVMAMSNILYSEITFSGGRVAQSNFNDYLVARMPAAPHAVDVHFIESGARPGGIGEPGVPPAGPAIANAIFAATGRRIRELPVGQQLAGWKDAKT